MAVPFSKIWGTGEMPYTPPPLLQIMTQAQTISATRQVIPPENIRALTETCNALAHELVVGLEAALASLPVEEAQSTVTYPANWWQHVRQRFCPRWWLRRYPVREAFTVLRVQKYAVCPHLIGHAQHKHLTWLLLQETNGAEHPSATKEVGIR